MQQDHRPVYTLGPECFIFIVLDEDPIIHSNEQPFCPNDLECPCREDSTLVRMFITKPLDNGLLTNAEAMRLYWGRQLIGCEVVTQEEPITDEPLRISAQFQQQMDSLLLEHD